MSALLHSKAILYKGSTYMKPMRILPFVLVTMLAACAPSAPAPAEVLPPLPVLTDLLGIELGQKLDVPHCQAGKDGYYLMAGQQPATPCWLSILFPAKPVGRKPPSEIEDSGYSLRFNDKQIPSNAENDVSVAIWGGKVHRIEISMNKYHSPTETRNLLIKKFGTPNVPEPSNDTLRWANDSAEAVYFGNIPSHGEAVVVLTTKAYTAHVDAERKARSANSF